MPTSHLLKPAPRLPSGRTGQRPPQPHSKYLTVLPALPSSCPVRGYRDASSCHRSVPLASPPSPVRPWWLAVCILPLHPLLHPPPFAPTGSNPAGASQGQYERARIATGKPNKLTCTGHTTDKQERLPAIQRRIFYIQCPSIIRNRTPPDPAWGEGQHLPHVSESLLAGRIAQDKEENATHHKRASSRDPTLAAQYHRCLLFLACG